MQIFRKIAQSEYTARQSARRRKRKAGDVGTRLYPKYSPSEDKPVSKLWTSVHLTTERITYSKIKDANGHASHHRTFQQPQRREGDGTKG
jgi:hypothetical protein